MKAVTAASRRPSMARPSISFAGRRRGERRARRPRGAARPPRRDRAGRRLDDRLGHLHRLGRHRAPSPLRPVAVSPLQAVGVAVILLLTALNARGLEAGRWVQNVFTVAKVGTLLAVIALGLALGGGAARATNLAGPAFATGLGPL